MIKVDYEDREGIVRLSFTSNNDEVDLLDAIGRAILTEAPKRGGYTARGTMVIDIKKPEEA